MNNEYFSQFNGSQNRATSGLSHKVSDSFRSNSHSQPQGFTPAGKFSVFPDKYYTSSKSTSHSYYPEF